MQAIKNIKKGVKSVFITALELLHVRLEMARIELTQQKERLIFTVILALNGLILMLIALISALFGLDALIIDPQNKVKLFFSISAVALFIVFILALLIINSLRKQRSFMVDTLQELKQDIVALKKLSERSDTVD